MRHWRLEFGPLILNAMIAGLSFGQATGPSLSRDDEARLERFRQIIENPDDSMSTRRVQAEELLRTPWSAAAALAADLLGSGSDPSTKIAICQAIASVGATDPSLLTQQHGGLVEPLIRLLGDSTEAVSARAAEALAAFPDGGVTERLGALAANHDEMTPRRLAAIEALAMSAYKREVVRQLVQLLPGENGEIQARVLAALRTVSDHDCGTDVAAWQTWWERQEAGFTDSQWLVARVKLFFDRLRQTQRELVTQQAEHDQRYATLAQRTTDLLRDHYRLVQQPAQKADLLTRWLADPLDVYRLAALTIISEEIQEGRLPSEPVVSQVVQGLTHRAPEIRRTVLGILGALSDPSNTNAVLSLLAEERDASVRQTAFRVLGQLRSPEAIPVLVREIAVTTGADATPGCVAEAAAALALIGAKGKLDSAAVAEVVPALADRYAQTPATDRHLRSSLLRAMASIGAPEFGPIFAAALESEQPDVLLPAIDGCMVVEDRANLERIIALTGHSDPRVRAVALRAVGKLGGEPAHLEVLLSRLNPATESNEGVRAAAWEAWQPLVDRKPAADQLQWADRLREVPERYVEYLLAIVTREAGHNPPSAELAEGRRRLATYYGEVGNHAAALPFWQQLYAQLLATSDPQADDVAIQVLTTALAAAQHAVVTEILTQLATAKPSVKARASRTVADFINAQKPLLEPAALMAVVEAVAAAPLSEYDEAFRTFIADVRKSIVLPQPVPTTAPAKAA